MKKITISLFTIVLALYSYCQEFIEFTSSETTIPTYIVNTSEDTIVEFELQIPGIFANELDSFLRVEIEDHTKLDSVGFPEMPVVSFLVAIPECDNVNLTIDLLDSVKIGDMFIYPAPDMVLDTNEAGITYYREEFVYYENAYNNDDDFPGIIAETVHKGAVRDQHCISVNIYPVQFNPVTREINAYSSLKIKLTFDNPVGSVNNDVGIFNELAGNSMINYNSNGLNASVSCGAGYNQPGSVHYDDILPDQKLGYPCDYLIITPFNFYNNTDIYALASYRAAFNGFDVVITHVDAIYAAFQTGDDYEKIRYLIRNTYNDNNANHTYDGKLAYVNLFGDVVLENFPTDGIPTYEWGHDIYYSQLTAGDPYPDLMIGRCSADDAEQVQNIVNKILNFEPATLSYKNNMLTVVGYDWQSHLYPMTSIYDIDSYDNNSIYTKYSIITPDYFEYGYEIPESWIPYQLTPFADNTIAEALEIDPVNPNPEDGQIFINYMGHGAAFYWWLDNDYNFSYSDLNPLLKYSVPFILSAACNTGAFWNEDNCMAERFICYNDDRGAIGFLGASIPVLTGAVGFPRYYYNAFFNNYSYMLGEAIMEVKISRYDYSYSVFGGNWMDDYNLFGDPALNMKYENKDILYPDLIIKDFEIMFHPEPIHWGEIINIEAKIRNITRINATSYFNVYCYVGEPGLPGTIEIGQYEIDGLEGNHRKTAYFTWDTQNFEPDIYDIYIYIDPENNINEEDETNNINSISKAIYNFYPNFPVSNNINLNAHVVTFDLYDEYIGQEIIFGKSIFTTGGQQINPFSGESVGNSCIANLANDDEYQIVQIHKTPNPKIVATGNPSWQYDIEGSKYSPIIFDINNDGLEEVICLKLYTDNSYKLLCLNSDGTLRWELEDFGDGPLLFYLDPIVGNFNGQNNSIILMNGQGTLFNIKETANYNPEIDYTYTIPNFNSIASVPVASDINKDGEVEIIFIYSSQIQEEIINILANYKAIDFSENNSIVLDYQSYINPIISDLNNDGESEIIIGESMGGLYIYNMDFELLNHIQDNNIINSELVTGGIYNNGNLDIICQVKIDKFYEIIAYDINGNQTFFTPVIGAYESCWLSDIIDENKFYFVYGDMKDLYIVNIPDAGTNIGWPGQRCNLRNTGVYEQPAFYPEIVETD